MALASLPLFSLAAEDLGRSPTCSPSPTCPSAGAVVSSPRLPALCAAVVLPTVPSAVTLTSCRAPLWSCSRPSPSSLPCTGRPEGAVSVEQGAASHGSQRGARSPRRGPQGLASLPPHSPCSAPVTGSRVSRARVPAPLSPFVWKATLGPAGALLPFRPPGLDPRGGPCAGAASRALPHLQLGFLPGPRHSEFLCSPPPT